MEIKYTNVTMNIPDSWDEITLDKYLEFNRVSETINEDENFENILKTIKVVEIITGATEEELDGLLVEEMNDLSSKVIELVGTFKVPSENVDHFNIDGIDYVASNPNSLTNGEYISINLLRDQYKDNYELFPRLLAVLIRPGKKEYDFETKEEKWVVEKFNKKDIENLEFRAKLFLAKAKAKDLLPVLTFFLSMSNE